MTTERYDDSWEPVGGCEDDEDCLDGSGDWAASSSSTRPSMSKFRIMLLISIHTFSSLSLFCTFYTKHSENMNESL